MHVWAVRVRLQVAELHRDIALFDIALDSKLRGCDVVSLRLSDILSAGAVKRRGIVLQQKTGRPVHFEITEQTRRSLAAWLGVRKERVESGHLRLYTFRRLWGTQVWKSSIFTSHFSHFCWDSL